MQKDELQSKTISFLRFPLIVGVVFIHFDLIKCGLLSQGNTYPGWFYFIINFFSEVIPQVGVPLFFVFSGYLFFYHTEFNIDTYKRKLLSRTKTLLIPYFLWNIIAVLVLFFYKIPFLETVFPDAAKMEIQYTPIRILNLFFDRNNCIFIRQTTTINNPYPINIPMWYIRELFVMVLLSPVIFQLIKKMKWWFVILLGAVWGFFGQFFIPDGSYFSSFCKAAFFFSWGAYYSIENRNFVEDMQKERYLPILYLPLAIFDALTKNVGFNAYIHNATVIVGIITFVSVAAKLLEDEKVKVNEQLTKCCFFVYALHNLIIVSLGKTMISLLNISGNIYAMLLLYFVVPVITILLCIAIYMLLKRFFPALCGILTGGR
ncbi:MAG: acyltransferase [Salinivirgaceae bacterium]|nr:acyltransferase [Salinivirgaceae bacterium]